jgi:hypothetical protein
VRLSSCQVSSPDTLQARVRPVHSANTTTRPAPTQASLGADRGRAPCHSHTAAARMATMATATWIRAWPWIDVEPWANAA